MDKVHKYIGHKKKRKYKVNTIRGCIPKKEKSVLFGLKVSGPRKSFSGFELPRESATHFSRPQRMYPLPSSMSKAQSGRDRNPWYIKL